MAQFTDNNGNGYPDEYEAQEAKLLQQINARRKAYMNRMGNAETQFVKKNPAPVDDMSYSVDDGDQQAIDDLFKD
jgi:hypothetical protein